MANAQVYKGGTPIIKYGRDAGEPVEYGPPFGRHPLGGLSNGPAMNKPPFDAHFNGASGQGSYLGYGVLAPRKMKWQLDNLVAAQPGVDDVIDMILIPVNHMIPHLRFDVVGFDPALAGATVQMTGSLYTVDPADPFNRYIRTEDAFFINAATAQGIAPIPLDVPSETIVWLTSFVNADIQGTAPNGGGALTITTADGYVKPYYVRPEFVAPTPAETRRFQTGGLLLGIKIVSLPTNTNVNIWDARYDFYLTTHVAGFDSAAVL